jgi:hypothetical protein
MESWLAQKIGSEKQSLYHCYIFDDMEKSGIVSQEELGKNWIGGVG